jgi:antitoxin component YwqK of YwqJK toxin-antitoxin module
MKKISLTFILLVVAITSSFAQYNKVDGKGLRKGTWYAMYKGDFLYYDYLWYLLDLDKMLVPDRETQSLNSSNYFEVVNYKKGVKFGEFGIYSSKKDNYTDKYPLIATGSYLNGKISGTVILFEVNSGDKICAIEYENGKIKDQVIRINPSNDKYGYTRDSYFDRLWKSYIKYDYDKPISQLIQIKNNVCTEQARFDGSKPVKIVKTESGFTVYVHGVDVDNITSGLWTDDKKTIEVAHYNNKWELNGLVTIFKGNFIPFDTTSSIYSKTTFKNGKKSGLSSLYNDDGKLFMELSYNDGMLNGISKYYLAETGQLIAEATYKDGLLNGKFMTYYLNARPGETYKGPICDTNINKNLEQILTSTKNIFSTTVPLFKDQGYKFSIVGDYKFFEANYLNGIMQGPLNYFHANGKKLFESIIENCEEKEYAWFDMNGAQISNKQKESIKKYFIQWDMQYSFSQCTNPGCGKKETCPFPQNFKTNIPLPEYYWMLETGLRPDNRCSKGIAYFEPVDWTFCNNRNFQKCNKVVRVSKKEPVIEKFSTSDLLTAHLVEGYNDRFKEFLIVFTGEFTNTLLDFTAKGLDDYMSPIYGNDWRKDVILRYNIK